MHTKKEIENQFDTWDKIDLIYQENEKLIKEVTKSIKDEEVIIVFTGAGSSGYIGDYLETKLNSKNKNIKYVSYYSPNIVSNPKLYLENKKILLVSFARSGNSPESVEAVNLANMYAKSVKHLIITCNKKGELAKNFPESVIVLPEETNDKGFAMTNSYSTMMLVASRIFGIDLDLKNIIKNAKNLYKKFEYEKITNCDFENIVILSDGQYIGLLNEFKLKFIELTNGNLGYYSYQYLNFRHGPKAIISKKTMVLMIVSGDDVEINYQKDIINELLNDDNKPFIITIGKNILESDNLTNYEVDLLGFELGISIIPTVQRAALELSLKKGFNPDNPSSCGSVNRVVKGVEIYSRKNNK